MSLIDIWMFRIETFALSGFEELAPEDEFIEKTAQTVKLMLDPNAAGINKKKQRKSIKFMSKSNTMQELTLNRTKGIKSKLNDHPNGWGVVNDKYTATDFTYQLMR